MYAFDNEGSEASGSPGLSVAAFERADAAPGTFVFRTAGGPPVAEFSGAGSALAFTPTTQPGELAYATTDGDAVHVWNLALHREVALLTGDTSTIDSVRFSPDGSFIITGCRDDTARVYYSQIGGAPLEILAGEQNTVTSASLGLDDEAVATTSSDGVSRVWASPVPRPTATVAGAGLPPVAVSYNTSATVVLDLSAGLGEVLDARTLRVLSEFRAPEGQRFANGTLSANGRNVYVLAGPYDRADQLVTPTSVYAFDARDGRLLARMPATPAGLILMRVDASGDRLVTVTAGGAASEWDPRSGVKLRDLPGTGQPSGVVFSPDGTELAITHYPALPASVNFDTHLGRVHVDVWNLRKGRLQRTIPGDQLEPQIPLTALYPLLPAAFSPNGRILAVAAGERQIDLYNPYTGATVHPPLPMAGTSVGSFADSLAFSPNGQMLAAGLLAGALTWRLPSYTGGAPFQLLPGGTTSSAVATGASVHVSFTSDSRQLITTGQARVAVWDAATGLELFDTYPGLGAAAPTGSSILSVNGGGLSIYPCDLCRGTRALLALARKRITFSRAEQAAIVRGS
jgi:WD40 repeat protein